jgi:hypothetical protein
MLHTDSSAIPGWPIGPLETAVVRGIVVPHSNNYEKWKFGSQVLWQETTRGTVSRTLQLLHSADATKRGTTVTDVCGRWAGKQTLHSVPSAFASSREDSVQLRATTSSVTRVVKLVFYIQTQMLHVLNLATLREEVWECASRSMHY